MKTLNTEEYDLIVTQALERYLEMPADEASKAIQREWHQQMAALLIDFIFRERFQKSRGPAGFILRSRSKGESHTNYLVPFCCGKRSSKNIPRKV